ncbi:MAG: 1-acyl-sn-glycerol-3-phosphate acyltransferase [Clostridia bacterium]|nr:1-acyl-sn-glycerol-3-phosphate acyltransferase [Clostridia bacterium]
MENNLEVIPIFFAVDDAYTPFLAVALESLIDNSSKNYYYSIKVLHTDVSDENKRKINKYKRQNVDIEFVDLNYYIEKVKDKLYTRDYYTKTTYFRLFIPDLYPQYARALYLDSDITVLGDISELYNVDIGNNLVAGVPDGIIQTIEVFQEYAEKVVGVVDYKKYFNAGILLMNLSELRKFKFQEKFLYLLETIKFKVAQDQDYLNRLCKGRVKIVDKLWNVMPLKVQGIDASDVKLIHYNMNYKPWHYGDILYQEFFWDYAKKTEFYREILEMKENYTDSKKYDDYEKGKKLMELAQKESDCVGDDRVNRKNEDTNPKSKDRLEVLEKIRRLEEQGIFDVDVENDPPTIPLEPDDIDYLRSSKLSQIKSKMATRMGEKLVNDLIREKKLIIKDIRGIENLQSVYSGAIITCNHFNPFDCFTVEKVFRIAGVDKDKKLFKVIREGNYTNFPGLYGFFFRNCDTLPLSSNKRTMIQFIKAIDVILRRGDFVLIYPEESMWWNYRKPKPLKNGAFNFAARSNVPVIPIFITMEDSNIMGEDGFPIQEYTVNIDKPIYPNHGLSEKENTIKMRDKNYEVWKKIYEDFYGIPLEYDILQGQETINE